MKKPNKASQRSLVYHKYNGHCAYCGTEIRPDKFQVDHLVAREYAKYHKLEIDIDHIDNLMPSCASCNIYKKEFTLEAFREQLGLLTKRLNDTITIYKIAKRFGLIEETNKEIKFYFEQFNQESLQ